MVCHNCGETGHKKSECPAKPRARPFTRRRGPCCENCSSSEHLGEECGESCKVCGSQDHTITSCTKHSPQTESPSASTINASSGAVPPTSTQAEVTNDNPSWQTGTNGDRDGEDPTADNGADRAVEEVADQELPPVIQSLEIPTTQTLTVKLDTQVLDQHITSCSVRFESSFEVPIEVAPRGLAHRTATVRFTTDNIADQLSVQEVEIDSDIVETLLPSTIRDSISSLLTSDDRDSRLYHISFTTDPSLYNDNSKVFLGRHFYADSDMGPYTSAIRAARDMLYSSEQVVVHFFTIDSEWIQDHISTVSSSLEAQYNEYMLSKWWKGGDVNVQKGMQLPLHERPAYQIPPRFQFDDRVEYLTTQFYIAISNLEKTANNPTVESVARIISFPGGSDRVFIACIAMTADTNLQYGCSH